MSRLLFFLLLLPLAATAQNYPQDYFRSPVNIPILLAGNFGECRGGHFHSGLDIKTNGKENLPIYAVADGYISRIKMDKGGFGHALYITHPNGYTTLYAHLNKFVPKVQRYLREQQYAREKWDIDLYPDAGMFPVKKGEQIAFSGNTGSSTAPHLHFEIRDTKTEHPLNPQLFGFKVTDTKAPIPLEIAIYDLRRSLYEQSPRVLPLKKTGTTYIPTEAGTVKAGTNVIGIGIHVNDYMDGSDNTLNFYQARLYVNDQLITGIALDDIGYDVTRYMHAYADYKTKEQKNKWIQCLFRLEGNQLEHLYKFPAGGDGSVRINEGDEAEVRIELTDNNGNTALVTFILSTGNVSALGPQRCDAAFEVNRANNFEDLNVSFRLPETALYDDVCFTFSKSSDAKAYSSVYQVHQSFVPVHNYFELGIKPERTIPFQLREKMALRYNDGKSVSAKAAAFTDKGWYSAEVRNFGAYSLIADTVAPVITPKVKSGSNLGKATLVSFTIRDAVTSVKSYRAELNGKWVVLEQHGSNFFYEVDSRCVKGKNSMVITATDENNNTRTLQYTFNR
ncbi:MAG: M23 family metallopeptidase [Flavipsychrobacter sp.]|nr:M23 family metallopeptidase [Flavipsychrobacter sp.]